MQKHISISNTSDVHKLQDVEKLVGKEPFLILVHAEWCIHCRILMEKQNGKASVWETVLKKNPGVRIVDIEYEAYQFVLHKKKSLLKAVLQKSVQGFPFIAKVDKMKKDEMGHDSIDVHVYDKPDRSYKNIQKFINEQSL